MGDEADAVEVFPCHQVDDVGDVGVEDHVLAQKVRAIAVAGERLRINLVAALFQNVGNAPPAPAAMPGAVNQHERFPGVRLRHRLCRLERRRADRRTERRAARDRIVRHRVLPLLPSRAS